MSEKVKLPKKVCDALDEAKKGFGSNKLILSRILHGVSSGYWFQILKNQDFDIITRSLVLGYEPEETPEEKIYKRYMNGFNATHCRTVFRAGIREALEVHGIHYDWLKEDAE